MIKQILAKLYRSLYPLDKVEMYKRMGVKIGDNCNFQFDVVIDFSHYWHIKIGNNVTLAPRVHVLAHDASTFKHFGYTKIGKVEIGDNTFVGASATILPNVKIGKNCIIGAGSVVRKDVPDGMVAAGNPAKVIFTTEEYINKIKPEFESSPKFEEDYTLRGGVTKTKQEEMNTLINDGVGFVR